MDWTEYDLGTLLSYEQPTPYIVESTDYKDTFKTPVLTAGKTFVIGYTNETQGIYSKHPVIIFDDFTTSTQYVNFSFKVKSSAMKILSVNESLAILKFVFYRMQIIDFDYSTHKRYWIQHYSKIKVKIPSLPEQIRIVSRIEELFSELDKAVETLQTIKQQLAVYRQAVLKEAFEGKLTEKWRSEHQDDVLTDFEHIRISKPVYSDTAGDENTLHLEYPDKWRSVRIGDVFFVEVGATPKRSIGDYWDGNINWVSSGEVNFNKITQTKEHITEEGLKNSSTNVHPKGTVFIAMIGEGKTRGKAAILDVEAAHNQNTAAILVSKTPCSPQYLFYYLKLSYENTRRIGSGNNQKALNKDRVRAIKFPFASFSEQFEIARIIESYFSKSISIEQTVDSTLNLAKTLQKSILKKAFEGRLI